MESCSDSDIGNKPTKNGKKRCCNLHSHWPHSTLNNKMLLDMVVLRKFRIFKAQRTNPQNFISKVRLTISLQGNPLLWIPLVTSCGEIFWLIVSCEMCSFHLGSTFTIRTCLNANGKEQRHNYTVWNALVQKLKSCDDHFGLAINSGSRMQTVVFVLRTFLEPKTPQNWSCYTLLDLCCDMCTTAWLTCLCTQLQMRKCVSPRLDTTIF